MKLPIFVATFYLGSTLVVQAQASEAGFLLDQSTYTCSDEYYGIGQPVDYARAYQCFESHRIYEYMIVMQLNGEGMPRDAKKAKELMQAWLQANPDNAGSVDETNMQDVVDQRLQDKNPTPPKIDYCRDVAQTTISIDFCGAVNDSIEQHRYGDTMAKIRAGLDPTQMSLWDEIQTEFAGYQRAEGDRLYQHYSQGTIRGAAFEGQMSYVRGKFLGLMQSAFGERTLPAATAEERKRLSAEIDSAYKADIDVYIDSMVELKGDPNFKEVYASDIATFKDDAQRSQEHWKTLRDLCSQLAASLYKKPGTDWGASMDVFMSKQRVLDIKNDPVR